MRQGQTNIEGIELLASLNHSKVFAFFLMKICENELKIIDKLKIKKKNSVANVPKKWFSTQNGRLDVSF